MQGQLIDGINAADETVLSRIEWQRVILDSNALQLADDPSPDHVTVSRWRRISLKIKCCNLTVL
jgi:hypothetical protein